MTDDHAPASVDPPIGSAAYWQLSPEEQLRICEERVGLCGDGFLIHGRPYADPVSNPIDDWS